MSASLPYFSIVIVGAGPTGLAVANLLGMYGLDALLIERNAALSDFPRAISLDDEGLRICQAMGLAERVQSQLLANLEAHYLSGKRLLAKVEPTIWRHGYPLISTFHQPTFEATLLEGLERFPSITLQFDHTLEALTQREESVIVSLRAPDGEMRQVECGYVLGCDGAKSATRNLLELSMQGATYAQRWLVVDSLHDPDPSTAVRFFCDPTRPAVTVPAPGRRRRWEFMLLPGEQEEQITRPERVQELVRQMGGPAQPCIERATVYTFHAALAESFQRGRIFLLGDAAHLMPPFGGQGMNCGLRDAHNLAWKLWLVLQNLADPALLATYTLERRTHARQMIDFSRFLGALIMTTARPIAGVRDMFLALANFLPAARDYLSEAGVKPAPRYTRGFLTRAGCRANRDLGGLMLPQPEIHQSDGQRVFLDEELGSGFALLCLNRKVAQPFACLAEQAIWRRLPTRLLTLDSEMRALLPVYDTLYLLVRPDRYIYGAFHAEQAADFARAFEQALRGGI